MNAKTLSPRWISCALAAVLPLMVCDPSMGQERTLTYPVIDRYGYAIWDHTTANCALGFVDIHATGAPLGFVASGTDPALDEGGSVVTLAAPFELYGENVTELVVSTNGYLAAVGNLVLDSGGDFSNDCPLPAVPEPGPGVSARLAVLHGDLSGSTGVGSAQVEYFASCPRPSEAIGNEACTVIQWTNWGRHGIAGSFDFQALLYHSSFEIVYQYGPGSDDASATLGLQNRDASVGLTVWCNTAFLDPAGHALCIFDPRFPSDGPSSDLELQIEERPVFAVAGGTVVYVASVTNHGAGPVTGAHITATVPTELDCTWICSGGPLSTCSAAGIGPIDDAATQLDPFGVISYEMECSVASEATGSLIVGFAAEVPLGVTDPNPGNNSKSTVTPVIDPSGLIFSDGFESGDMGRWTVSHQS
ncbi:MAG: hypothetical protein ACC742_06280 [Thermoanaerobaculales bacterium]